MNLSDPGAKNLFARPFTYAPRPAPELLQTKQSRRRNALEDFCTEALAWCLIHSKPFAEAIFRTFPVRPDTFEIHTQLNLTGEADDDPPDVNSRSQFDLVVTSTAGSIVIVIECKVAFDEPGNIDQQIAKYRDRLKRQP